MGGEIKNKACGFFFFFFFYSIFIFYFPDAKTRVTHPFRFIACLTLSHLVVLNLCCAEASGQFFAMQMSVSQPQRSDLMWSQASVIFEVAQLIPICSWDGELPILARPHERVLSSSLMKNNWKCVRDSY